METSNPILHQTISGVLEVDAFCTRCNYNLHGQSVTIDDRLGFPICRCPECGTFHPAGTGITAGANWVRRFASGLLFFWIVIVLNGMVGLIAVFCLLADASVEMFDYTIATTRAPNHWRFQVQLSDWHLSTTPETCGLSVMVLICAGSIFAGFIAGTLCVTLMWHWKFSRYFDVLILPFFSAVIMILAFYSRVDFDLIRLQCVRHVLVQTGIQAAGILIGVLVGRNVSRAIIMGRNPAKVAAGTGVSLAGGWQKASLVHPHFRYSVTILSAAVFREVEGSSLKRERISV